jgi:uncharacterized protein with von Willebrand factor type A (vWA) domain
VILSTLKEAREKVQSNSIFIEGIATKVFESRARDGWAMSENDIIELAEYFPGGTDFNSLDKASELLNLSKFKRGDVVFITDGECDVGEDWLKDS